MRRQLIAVLVAAALAGGVAVVPGAGLLAQEDAQEEPTGTTDEAVTEDAVEPAPAAALVLGERVTTAVYDLEAQALFTAPKPDPLRIGRFARLEQSAEKTEVRVAIAMRNNSDTPLGFSDSAFAADPAYPRLSLVDGANVVRPLSLVELPHHAVGQADLRVIDPGMTARWTVGWTIPTDAAGQLRLVATHPSGVELATWDLMTSVEPAGWEPPAGAEPIAFGDTVDWNGNGLEVTPVDFGTLVCGDPEVEYVTQVVALQFDVGNRSFPSDVRWPTVTFPESAAVARWGNGSAAAVTYETFSGEREVLQKVFADQAIVPSSLEPDYPRALLFATPRDGRLGSVTDAPEGVLLTLGDGTERWLPLGGSGTVALNPALCASDFLDYVHGVVFAPSLAFEVGDPPIPPDDTGAQDVIAQELLQRAFFGVGVFFEANGTFLTMTSAALEATGVNVDFTNNIDFIQPGAVVWGAPSEIDVILVTQSESGRFFCAGGTILEPPRFGDGLVLDEVIGACAAPVETVPDEEAEGDAGAGEAAPEETTTTTTTTAP